MPVGKRTIFIGIAIAVLVIPIAFYTISPLFLSKTVNEPAPVGSASVGSNDTSDAFEQFMKMNEQERYENGKQMSDDQKEVILKDAALTPGATVNEDVNGSMTGAGASVTRTGTFIGVNDGIHNAEGSVRVISLADGSGMVLRLEDFRSTNGPDLYVYLSADKTASDFVSLGRLKGNIGNQNYDIPGGTDLARYDTVLIWCKAFSVLFGSAELKPSI